MNYLAHAYLSFHQPEILVGNMISDYVKGKKKFAYSPGVQNGIALHRAIDTFTDYHAATKAAKVFFKPAYGLYSGAMVDVVYDHFLAKDPLVFPGDGLQEFSQQTYSILSSYTDVFPERFQVMLPYMKTQNWLYNYQFAWGIEKSLEGVVRRAVYLYESATAFKIFEENYAALQQCYNDFFPSVKVFVENYTYPD